MQTLRPILTVIGVCALTTWATGIVPVAAQPTAQPRGACRSDIQKFCKDVKPGGGRMRECLKSHEAELSAECRAHLQAGPGAAKQRPKAGGRAGGGFMAACREDVDKFCKDTQPGQGRVQECLRSHESELSEACKAQLPRAGASPKKKRD